MKLAPATATAHNPTVELTLVPKQLAKALFWVVVVLTAIHSVVLFLYFYWDDDYVFGLVELFDFDIEGNIPTFYSATALLLAALLLALASRVNWRREQGYRYHWLLLSGLFLFLCLDEATAIHEWIGVWFEDYIEPSGFLYFMWVVPYGVAVIVIGLLLLKFLLALPVRTRNRFVAAAALFLTGAIGLEVFGAREADINGTETITYCLLYTIEEVCEMLGVIVFIYALSSHLANDYGQLRISLADEDASSKRDQSTAL